MILICSSRTRTTHVCFKGGSFLDNSGSTNDLAGTNLNFDTSQYEEMLKQMFATGSDKDEGSPFDLNKKQNKNKIKSK
jgi:hypothetical protein